MQLEYTPPIRGWKRNQNVTIARHGETSEAQGQVPRGALYQESQSGQNFPFGAMSAGEPIQAKKADSA